MKKLSQSGEGGSHNNPTARWPAVMRSLQRNLNSHCTSLKSLTLRKVGVISPAECHTYRYLEEAYLFREWSKFVRSVKATLEVFKFEHGTNRNFEQRNRVHPVRTIDWCFGLRVFLGIICEPWPCLKRMEFRGVRSWRGYDYFIPLVSAKKQYGGRPFDVSIKPNQSGNCIGGRAINARGMQDLR